MARELKSSRITQLRSNAAPATSSSASGSRHSRRLQTDAGVRHGIKSKVKRLNRPSQSDSGSKGNNEGDCKVYGGLETHALLSTLGAPTITQADLQRVCEDATGFEDALRFLEAHIVGRGEVNRVRQAIARKMLVDGSSSSLGQNGDAGSAYTQHFEATRRLYAAEAETERIQREVDNAHTVLLNLELETDTLQAALRQKRLVNDLLSVLEKKVNIRTRRVEEIGRILRAVRDGAQSVANRKSGVMSDVKSMQDMPRQKPHRADAVQDTLAMLQGYHSRLARVANMDNPSSLSYSEAYLLAKISEAMRRPQDDPKVERSFKSCLATAKQRASQKIQYATPMSTDSKVRISNQILTTLEQQVVEKETQLQRTNDHISAIRMSCTESLRLLITFRDSTVSILQESLDEDTNMAKNHVRILRKSIEQGCINLTPNPSSVQSYQQKITQTRADILAEHEHRHFLAAATLHPPVDSTHNEDTLSQFRAEQDRLEEGLRKVLQRKVDKSRVGDELVQDLNTVVYEIQTVTNVL